MESSPGNRTWSGRPGPSGVAVALGLILAGAAALFAFWYLPRWREAAIAGWSRELGERAELRREALTRFFVDGLASAATVAAYPSNVTALESTLAAGGAEQARAHVAELLGRFVRGHADLGAVLWSAPANPAVTTTGLALDDGCAAAARDVLASGEPVLGIHRHAGVGPVLTFSAPVKGPDGVARGVVTILEDPRQWLYPFLARPFSGFDSGEAALVAREGDYAVLLSPLRGRPDAALSLRRPLGQLGLGARAAFEGSEATSVHTDYRGVRVLATGRRLPPSAWVLATKVDVDDVLRGVRGGAWRSAAALAAFLLTASALVWGLAQRRERLQKEALATSEARYHALFDGMLNGFAYGEVHRESGRPADFTYLAVNRAFGELTGLRNVVGRRVSEVIPGFRETNAEILEAYGRVAETGDSETFESYVPALDRWFSISTYSPEKGRFVAIFDNITERKKAEAALFEAQQQLAQSQKMEAVGRLAGGVAHDFNNLLTVIRGYAELLAPALEPDPDRHEEIAEILKAAERATTLTGQLLAFSRRQTLEMRPIDLRAVVTDTEKMLRRLIGEDISLEVSLPPSLGTVNADRGQIEQVLLNLAVNARDAMPHGGPLRIALYETAIEEPFAAADGPVPPGPYVVLAVADEGSGMSPDTLAHAFEPFYTTKEKGRGTGLGLSTVFGIVKQSGGYILARSAVGAGTTLELYFPRAGAEDAKAAPVGTGERGGSETILVAEDEAGVRDLAGRFLARWGYRILSAESGPAALARARAERGPIDLLLTDLVMPGMSGVELTRALAAERPGLKVLLMSGYSHDVLADFPSPAPPLLRKPFTESDLVRHVRAALDGAAPPGFAGP